MTTKLQDETTARTPTQASTAAPLGSFASALGTAVRARRTLLGLNQADVADLAGVSERFVRFVEQGKATVQLEPLLAVLGTLGLELAVQPAQTPAHAGSPDPGRHSGHSPAHRL